MGPVALRLSAVAFGLGLLTFVVAPVVVRVGMAGDTTACSVDNAPALSSGYDDWDRTVLDTRYTLGRDYVPPDLGEAKLGGRRFQLRSFILPDLDRLFKAAGDDGVALTVDSAYRSFDGQAKTYQSLADAYGDDFAAASAARPGHSEHQLGTTVDLGGGAEWLGDNAWRYGFALSYPDGASPQKTCYKPESWHYRYFGPTVAAEIRSSGLSPREWLLREANGTPTRFDVKSQSLLG